VPANGGTRSRGAGGRSRSTIPRRTGRGPGAANDGAPPRPVALLLTCGGRHGRGPAAPAGEGPGRPRRVLLWGALVRCDRRGGGVALVCCFLVHRPRDRGRVIGETNSQALTKMRRAGLTRRTSLAEQSDGREREVISPDADGGRRVIARHGGSIVVSTRALCRCRCRASRGQTHRRRSNLPVRGGLQALEKESERDGRAEGLCRTEPPGGRGAAAWQLGDGGSYSGPAQVRGGPPDVTGDSRGDRSAWRAVGLAMGHRQSAGVQRAGAEACYHNRLGPGPGAEGSKVDVDDSRKAFQRRRSAESARPGATQARRRGAGPG